MKRKLYARRVPGVSIATLEGLEKNFEAKSAAEAIGDMVLKHPELFGIIIVDSLSQMKAEKERVASCFYFKNLWCLVIKKLKNI